MKLLRGAIKSDPISIIERYRKECGSLKVGEIERLRNSVMMSSVIAESHEQNKNEEQLLAIANEDDDDYLNGDVDDVVGNGDRKENFLLAEEYTLGKLVPESRRQCELCIIKMTAWEKANLLISSSKSSKSP